jgi:hypothetical protein
MDIQCVFCVVGTEIVNILYDTEDVYNARDYWVCLGELQT